MTEEKDKSLDVEDLYGVEDFAGKYHVGEQIGAGSYGCVYRATDPRLNRDVALKVLKPRGGREDEEDVYGDVVRERFKREARLVAGLKEPSTVTVHEWDEWQGMLYAAYEYIEGKSLGAWLEEGKRFTPREWIKILEQILDSLAEAHRKGIVHRDIKPANIMLTEHDRRGFEVKVLDFGIGKMLRGYGELAQAHERDFNTLTRADESVGTTRYMSPEQLRGEKLTPACDVWALGVVCAEALTGRQGFSGEPYTIITKIIERGTREIKDVLQGADIPEFLEQMVEKMTQSDLEKRYRSAAEILEDKAFELLKSQPKDWEDSGLVGLEEEQESLASTADEAPSGSSASGYEEGEADVAATIREQPEGEDAPTEKARPKALGKSNEDMPRELRLEEGKSEADVGREERRVGKYAWPIGAVIVVAVVGWTMLPTDEPNTEPPSANLLDPDWKGAAAQEEVQEEGGAVVKRASKEEVRDARDASADAIGVALSSAREVLRAEGERKPKKKAAVKTDAESRSDDEKESGTPRTGKEPRTEKGERDAESEQSSEAESASVKERVEDEAGGQEGDESTSKKEKAAASEGKSDEEEKDEPIIYIVE